MGKTILTFLLIGLLASFHSQGELMPLDKDLTNVTYPFKVNFHSFTSQGQELKMAFMDLKPMDANEKIVLLLHGKNFNAAYWEETIRALTREGYRVIDVGHLPHIEVFDSFIASVLMIIKSRLEIL